MERLCYGSFAQVLKQCIMNGKTQFDLHIALLSALDPRGVHIDSIDETQANKWFNCKNNLSPRLVKSLEFLDPNKVVESFESEIIKLLDPNKITIAYSVILHIIKNDKKIMSNTIVDIFSNTSKAKLIKVGATASADFLAGVFLYAVTYVKNIEGKEFIPKIDESYISKIINSEASASDNDEILLNKSGSNHIRESIKKAIWEAGKRDYFMSRSEGSRFAGLNILSGLLPQGHTVHADFIEHGRNENGDIRPLLDLIAEYENHNISIIGEGGVGKTTSLIKIMEGIYENEYNEDTLTPVFIELNQCTGQIGQWYSTRRKKTNFVTRYIAAQLLSCELDEVSSEVLNSTEGELSKNNEMRTAEYLILLDGFNEVSREKAIDKNGTLSNSYVRELLNNEIKAVMNYPNVRVITTSRKMDMAYFSGMTKNIELTGIKTDDIENHLRKSQFDEMEIKSIKSAHKLMDCLRIPLFLCMFTTNDVDANSRPVTRGEILYRFFHNSRSVYNERLNAQRIKMSSTLDAQQMLFILDFIIPYIGHMMEWADRLSSGKPEILEAIEMFLENREDKLPFWDKKTTAFNDYEKMEEQRLCDVRDSLFEKGSGEILGCIVNTFGIMYCDGRSESRDTFRYHFIHHHIRDYFASIYEIQRIRMAIDFRREYLESSRGEYIGYAYDALYDTNEEIWSEMKQVFVGEILGEHRNAPIMNKENKWELPSIIFREQNYLRYALDVLRLANKRILHGVYNITETMKKVRGSLAGENFSSLDLSQCRFHGTTLSVGRGENMLSASFENAIVSDSTFRVEGDCGEIIEFVYSVMGTSLFTLSEDGIVKCWETYTGKCLRTSKIPNWDYYSYKCALNYFIVASKEHTYLTHGLISEERNEVTTCYVQELNFTGDYHVEYTNDVDNAHIRSMRYSADSEYIITVSDSEAGENYFHIYKSGISKHIYKYQANKADTFVTALMVGSDEVVVLICNLELDITRTELNCRLDLMNINTSECNTLHKFTTIVGNRTTLQTNLVDRRVPVFCVSSTGEKIAFIDDGFISEYNLETKKMMRTGHKIEYAPTFMNYLESDKDYIISVFEKKAYKYHMKKEHEPQILFQNNYDFDIRGSFSGSKFLVFDEDRACYEWDIVKDTIQLKYKHHKMAALWMFLNNTATEIIITFDNDCVLFIDAKTGELTNTINLGERDVNSGMCLYDKTRNALLALLENESYEFIKCFDITTCKLTRSYYDFISRHKIRSMEVSSTSEHLLCAFDKKVSVIDLNTLLLTDVYAADSNEQIRAAHFFGDGNILIALCEESRSLVSILGKAYIYEFRQNSTGLYQKSASYKPPVIPGNIMRDYVSGSNITYGIENNGSVDTLCMDAGIFLRRNDSLTSTLTIDKHIWDKNNVESVINYTPPLNDFFYICYLESFNSNERLVAINDDRSLIAVLELLSQHISIFKYNGMIYEKINELSFTDKIIDGCVIHDETLLYCLCSGGEVFSIDLRTDVVLDYPNYVPGLMVIGCNFRRAKMNNSTRDLLALHGGIFE